MTVIQLGNCDVALYLHGNCLACADFSQKDDPVCGVGERLAETLGVPFRLLTLPVPDDEWAWNDVVTSMGWGKARTLGSMTVRAVLECSTAHMILTDRHLLGDLSCATETQEWIHDTGVGFMIRLDAVRFPVLKLKLKLKLKREGFRCCPQGYLAGNEAGQHQHDPFFCCGR